MESYYGEIQAFGFNYAPRGWAYCWGQLVAIQSNTALYALLGTYYGGNGTSTFGLPDLRGRVAVGQGSGLGLTPVVIGEDFGVESLYITIAQMPAHTHTVIGGSNTVKASSQPGTQPNPTSTVKTLAAFNESSTSAINSVYNNQAPNTLINAGTTLSGTVANTGSGLPISMMQPTLGMNYCICVEGYYPQRN